jgi:hypothetical protein
MALTNAQIHELIGKNAQFKTLVETYGMPNSVASCDVPGAKPGDICVEGNCVNAKKEVMFCDANLNCTGFDTVAC